MSKRIKELLNTLAASTQRVMKAIEIHTHPDLAKANHLHDDLATKLKVDRQFDTLYQHHLPGAKRQTVLFSNTDGEGNSNFLGANIENVIDPDYVVPPIVYHHLMHFNSGVLIYNEDPNSTFASKGFWSAFSGNVNTVAGGVAGTNKVELGNASSSIATIYQNGQIPLYSDKQYWSESFVWKTHRNATSSYGTVRNILRHVPNPQKLSQDTKGFWLRLTGNGRLQLTIQKRVFAYNYIALENIDFFITEADLNPAQPTFGLDDGNPHAIEVFYRNGYYSIWIDGVKKPLRDSSGNIISDGNNEYQYGNVWVSEIVTSQSNYNIRLFGGVDGGGCRGSIDEYAFKEVDATYDPSTNPIVTNTENVAATPPPNYIGVNKTVSSNVGQQLVLSASDGILNYNTKIVQDFTFDNLPINNRVYFYLENNLVNDEMVPTLKYSFYPPVNDQVYRYNCISQLYVKHEVNGDTITNKLADNFGINWDYDPAKIDLVENLDINNFSNFFKVTMKLLGSDSYIASNIFRLGSRWSIQIAFKRNSANYGVIFQTTDKNGVAKKGLKVEYLDSPQRLKFTISTDGSTEESVEISDALVTTHLNDVNKILMIDFFYTGYKYGFRLGYVDSGVAYLDHWVDFSSLQSHGRSDIYYLDFNSTLPVSFEDGATFDDDARISIGGSANVPTNLEVIGMNVLPFVYSGIPTLSDTANTLTMSEITYLPDNIQYFNKGIMGPMYFSAVADSLGSRPTFNYGNQNKNFVYFGHAELDQGGIRDLVSYALNGKYESDWIKISLADEIKLRHAVGDTDLSVDIFINKTPTDEGKWKDAGIYYYGGDTYGVGVKEINETDIILRVGDTSVANTASSPQPGANISEAYMKVSVTRNW